MKEPLLISACLCGKNVRYDQKNKRHPFFGTTFGNLPIDSVLSGGGGRSFDSAQAGGNKRAFRL